MRTIARKVALVGALTGVLLLGTASSCISSTQSSEVEDCDAEDYRNRESECGFLKIKPTKTGTDTVKPKTTTGVKPPTTTNRGGVSTGKKN